MPRRRTVVWTTIGLLALAPVVMLAALSWMAKRPANLAGPQGQLAPCPNTPNCVCTLDRDAEHSMEPLKYQGSPDAAMTRLRQVIESQSGARVITCEGNYLYAEFTSLIFRFVDDVECVVRAEGVIDFRSASRVGRSDLGANRKRMEAIRQAFAEQAPVEVVK